MAKVQLEISLKKYEALGHDYALAILERLLKEIRSQKQIDCNEELRKKA